MSLGSRLTRQFIRVHTRRTLAIRCQSTLIQALRPSHVSGQNTQFSSSTSISHSPVQLPSDEERLRALLTKGKEGGLAIDFAKTKKLSRSTVSRLYERVRPTPFVQTFSASDYAILAREFNIFSHQALMGYLAEDLLLYFPREHNPAEFAEAIAVVLNNAAPLSLLAPSRILALYNAFFMIDSIDLPDLSHAVWERIFNAALLYTDDCVFTLQSLGEAFWKQTQRTGHFSLRIPQLLSNIILELLMQGEDMYKQALTLFKLIVQHELLPGIKGNVEEGSSFKLTIARCLIFGHLLTHDYTTSIEFVLRLLQDLRWINSTSTTDHDREGTNLVALEVLHAVVREPSKKELESSIRLVQALVPSTQPPWRNWVPIDIPDGDVQALYDHCFRYNLVNDASALYVYFHYPYIRSRRYYPPPRGTTLFWLFEYFADPGLTDGKGGEPAPFRGHLRMAKNILRDIAVRNVPVPVNDRRKFIAICASRGFAFYTRYFYELWTKDDEPDRNAVRGSGQMLVPVVKLFRKLQNTWDDSLEKRPDQKSKLGGGKRTVLPDAWRFAHHVVQRYIETKLPLNKASQQDINALARAYLVLDRIPEAIQTLSIITDRGDIPDSKDINIALSAISIYSVPVAVRMLESTIRMGVMPSASGFSALIHEALKQGHNDIAKELVAQAKRMGYPQLTPKGLVTIVQSVLPQAKSMVSTTQGQEQNRLRTLKELLDTVIRYFTNEGPNRDHCKQHLLSIRMGERYITAALAAGEPAMAVEFWKLLVKNRTSWDDPESTMLRQLIGAKLEESKLDSPERESLLRELKRGVQQEDRKSWGKNTPVDHGEQQEVR